jgi:sterol desaturase/sphingolipid hydroxylase (fatty acid hydroxylase superfamily)
VGLVAALLLSALVWWQLRREGKAGGRSFLAWLFPKEVVLHPSTRLDLKVGIVNSVFVGNALNLTWRFNAAVVVVGVTGLLTALFGPGPQEPEWSLPAILAFALLLSMANDLGYFLFHWASHVFPPFWAFHKLHHSAEVLTPLTFARVHPMERAILGPFRALTVGLVMGPALYLYAGEPALLTVLGVEAVALAFRALGFVLHHSHVRLHFGPVIGRVIVSPMQHQVHHSSLPQHIDKNFAEFWSFWDVLFGTFYMPRRDEPMKFGLAGEAQPHPTLARAYLVPFRDAVVAGLALPGQIARKLGWRRAPEATPADQAGPQRSDPARL